MNKDFVLKLAPNWRYSVKCAHRIVQLCVPQNNSWWTQPSGTGLSSGCSGTCLHMIGSASGKPKSRPGMATGSDSMHTVKL